MKEKHEPIDFRNHRYSSIDMARETGMSSEGLRFYERKGILQVDKDEKNGYRTYPIMKVPMMRSAKILGTSPATGSAWRRASAATRWWTASPTAALRGVRPRSKGEN